jgi:hypothetical protein
MLDAHRREADGRLDPIGVSVVLDFVSGLKGEGGHDQVSFREVYCWNLHGTEHHFWNFEPFFWKNKAKNVALFRLPRKRDKRRLQGVRKQYPHEIYRVKDLSKVLGTKQALGKLIRLYWTALLKMTKIFVVGRLSIKGRFSRRNASRGLLDESFGDDVSGQEL